MILYILYIYLYLWLVMYNSVYHIYILYKLQITLLCIVHIGSALPRLSSLICSIVFSFVSGGNYRMELFLPEGYPMEPPKAAAFDLAQECAKLSLTGPLLDQDLSSKHCLCPSHVPVLQVYQGACWLNYNIHQYTDIIWYTYFLFDIICPWCFCWGSAAEVLDAKV